MDRALEGDGGLGDRCDLDTSVLEHPLQDHFGIASAATTPRKLAVQLVAAIFDAFIKEMLKVVAKHFGPIPLHDGDVIIDFKRMHCRLSRITRQAEQLCGWFVGADELVEIKVHQPHGVISQEEDEVVLEFFFRFRIDQILPQGLDVVKEGVHVLVSPRRSGTDSRSANVQHWESHVGILSGVRFHGSRPSCFEQRVLVDVQGAIEDDRARCATTRN
eukprot:CAMPEP_0119550756 /NCGR_PEP_ID=MMETSP1352-20130426/4212_1 /TAXON_ID=265584 /ORGANISM="Stauroneis constricta, Strain CCMP1120" /LENGTH=216 /DNA_ID=CAMNT_0007596705 /DNA_START=128 /DNA_END=775 /DNA_ORIENTATION=+